MSENNKTLREVFLDALTYLERSEGILFSNSLNMLLQYMYMDNLLTLETIWHIRDILQMNWKYLETNPDGTVSCYKESSIIDVFEPVKLGVFIVKEILKDKQFSSLIVTKDYDYFLKLLERSRWNAEEKRLCENTASVRKLIYMEDAVFYLEEEGIYSLPQKGFHIAYTVNKRKNLYYGGVKELLFNDQEYHRIYASLATEEGYVCLQVKEHKARRMKNAAFLGVDPEGREWLYSKINKSICSYHKGKLKLELKESEIEKKVRGCKHALWESYLDGIIEELKSGEISRAIRLQELYEPPIQFSIKEIRKKLKAFNETESEVDTILEWMNKLEQEGIDSGMDISELLYEKRKEPPEKVLTIILNYGII